MIFITSKYILAKIRIKVRIINMGIERFWITMKFKIITLI